MDIVPGGTELELQLRRAVGQAAHTPTSSLLEFIRHKQLIMLKQLNCIEFNSRDLGSLR